MTRTQQQPRPCPFCGDPLPKYHRAVCTRPDCRRAYKARKARLYPCRGRSGKIAEERVQSRECRHCGAVYTKWGTGTSWPATCSPACRRKWKTLLTAASHVRNPPKNLTDLKLTDPNEYLRIRERINELNRRRLQASEGRAARLERAKQHQREYVARQREVDMLRDLDQLAAAGRDDSGRDSG